LEQKPVVELPPCRTVTNLFIIAAVPYIGLRKVEREKRETNDINHESKIKNNVGYIQTGHFETLATPLLLGV